MQRAAKYERQNRNVVIPSRVLVTLKPMGRGFVAYAASRFALAAGAVIVAAASGCGSGTLTDPHGGGGGGAGGQGGSGVLATSCNNLGAGTGTAGSGGVATGGSGGFDGRACRCSRRPGENNSWMCPPGTGKVVTAEVGPAGGTVLLDGTPATLGAALKLEIPINALAQTVTIQVTELTTPPPQPYMDASPIYDLQPAGLTFATPPLLTIPYTNVSGIIPRELAAYLSTDGCASFARIGDSYIDAGFLRASLSQLGQVFSGYPRSSADDIACVADAGTD